MDGFRKFIQSTLGRVFLGIVLVIFVLFGFGTQFQMPGSQGELADVGGERISPAELDDAVESVMARYAEQFDRRTLAKLVDRNAVLESLIRQKVLLLSAREIGLIAHPAVVQESILAMEGFQDETGKYSETVFRQVLQRNGFANPAAFRTRIEDELLGSQLTGALRDSAFATRQDLELVTRMVAQTRDIGWLVLAPAAWMNTVAATDAEVQAHYDNNPAGYMTEEQFALEYVEVRLDDYAEGQSVAEADVRAKYDEFVARSNENAERRAAHILIAIGKDRSEQDAQARADQVIAKLAAGESFAKLAGEFSDDPGSAVAGGDLGYLNRGVLDPALDQALFALKVNEVSAPVRAADGLHLLRLLDIRSIEAPSFEAARADIVAGLKRDQAREEYDRLVDELGTLGYESDNLEGPAKKLGLEVRSTGLFGRQGGPGIAANPKVMEEALSDDVLEDGRNSPVIELAEGQAAVVRIKEHRKAQRRPFAEVAAEVRHSLLREKAGIVARDKAQLARAAIVAGKSLDAVAAEFGMAAQHVPAAQRGSNGIPAEVLQAAFRIKAPADGALASDVVALGESGAQAVFTVGKVVDGNLLAASADDIHARRGELAATLGRFDFTHFIEAATAQADIERFRENDKKGETGSPERPPMKKDMAPADSTLPL